MLKKTSAAGSVAIAATAAAAGILLTGSPASAQGLIQGHHRHHVHVASSNRIRNHNRNVNLNKNRNRVVVHVRIHNRNNNVAVANNHARRGCCARGRFFHRDGFFRPTGFFHSRGCCRRFLDDDDGFLGDRFDRIHAGGIGGVGVFLGPRTTRVFSGDDD